MNRRVKKADASLGVSSAAVRLSVIITNYNTRELLKACLRSVEELLDSQEYEFIVVDNASADGSPEMVREEFPQAQLIAQQENVGFSRANNVGLQAASGRYLLILNSDTEMLEGAFQKMCDFMDSHPDVGVLGPQLLNTDRTVQLSCRRFPTHRTALFHRYSLLTRLFPQNRYSSEYLMTECGHDKTIEADWVSGACLMTRREAVEQVGLLDEDFFMYAEDVDWCYRMKQAGWKVVYFPEAKVMHHIGRSTRQVPYRMTRERHRSMWLFYKKHYSRGIPLIDVATWLGIQSRCALMISRNVMHSVTQGEKRS